MKQQTVYIPIQEIIDYNLILNTHEDEKTYLRKEQFDIKQLICLSKEELIELLGSAFKSGSLYRSAELTNQPEEYLNKEQFINNILL